MPSKKLKITSIAVVAATILVSPAIVSAATETTTISSVVGATISLLSTNTTVNIDTTPNGAGVQTIASDTVTVSTNDSAGYTLKLAENTAETSLKDGSKTIPASAADFATPAKMEVNTWGYRVDGVNNFGAGTTTAASNVPISGTIKFAKVPATASPDTIKTTSGIATNDTTMVWYGVATNTSTASGTYTNVVVYTATPN